MTYGVISRMVDSLGDTGHSTFLSPDMAKQLNNTERGEFKGIGVEIQMREGTVVVVASLDNSPAQRAGLRAGDAILKVNGQDIAGWPLHRVVKRITGPAVTQVQLTVLSSRTGNTREVSITRAAIKLHEVTWAQLPGTAIAHLRIASFSGNVAKEFRSALIEIRARKLLGIVLDLRNNPGGVLGDAIEIASQFLKSGNVLLVKDGKGRSSPCRSEKAASPRIFPWRWWSIKVRQARRKLSPARCKTRAEHSLSARRPLTPARFLASSSCLTARRCCWRLRNG
jgi:carboxyl-terminal processing protease